MHLGISTATFFNRYPTESCFDVLRQLRVDTTEVFFNTYSEYEKTFVENLLERKGMVIVHSVHALSSQFEPELYSSNPRVRDDAEIMFRKVCYAGNILGAKFYTFHGPMHLKKTAFSLDITKFAQRTNELVDIAMSYGIKLSYENIHYAYFCEPEFFEQLKQLCPNLYATLDIKQALQSETDPLAYIAAMGDRISTVHICDAIKKETCLPGQGKANWEKIIREVYKKNPTAPLLLELYSKDYSDLNQVKEAYNYIQNIMLKVIAT